MDLTPVESSPILAQNRAHLKLREGQILVFSILFGATDKDRNLSDKFRRPRSADPGAEGPQNPGMWHKSRESKKLPHAGS